MNSGVRKEAVNEFWGAIHLSFHAPHAGSIELYTPAIFQSAQRDMQQTFQKAFDSIQTK
jgi:hypothetical protein